MSETSSISTSLRDLPDLLGGETFWHALPIGVYCCDRDGVIVRYNRRAAELWGRSPTIGDPRERYCGCYKLALPDCRPLPHDQTPMAAVLRTGKPARDQRVVIEREDGSRLSVLVNIDPLFDPDGALVGAVNCFQDVTALERAEARVEDGERRFRDVLEALPAAIYTTDADGKITFYNRAAVALSGREPELGSDEWCVSWRLYWPDGTPMPHDECPMAVTLQEGRPVRGTEAVGERPDGERFHFIPFPTPLFDESGRLTGGVNLLLDITERRETEIELAHLAAIVESSDDAIVSKSMDGHIRSWNAGAQRLFGYTDDEVVGESIKRIIPPELHEEEDGILERLRNGERIEHFETERLHRDQRRIHVSLTVSPVRDRSGQLIGASSTARDITERRRAEELQRLLVNELNHRVKNTLAAVQSIASQTVRHARSPSEFVDSFSGRIRSLAYAHELLSSNAWKGADVFALVRDQLMFEGTEDGRLSMSGPAVTLAPQAALHLSMVLHELVTNAYKYGSLSAPNGRLAVTWSVRTNGGRDLALQWKESGGPPVEPPTTRGFGSVLIEKSLAAHGGEAVVRFPTEGVTCDIRLPLPEPVRSRVDALLSPAARLAVSPATTVQSAVRGRRVLVVEDEPLVAMDLAGALTEAGHVVVGPAATIEAARKLIDAEAFDAALLDANLNGVAVDEIAEALSRLATPFAFVTGYGRDELPADFRDAAIVSKPFDRRRIEEIVAQLVRP